MIENSAWDRGAIGTLWVSPAACDDPVGDNVMDHTR